MYIRGIGRGVVGVRAPLHYLIFLLRAMAIPAFLVCGSQGLTLAN